MFQVLSQWCLRECLILIAFILLSREGFKHKISNIRPRKSTNTYFQVSAFEIIYHCMITIFHQGLMLKNFFELAKPKLWRIIILHANHNSIVIIQANFCSLLLPFMRQATDSSRVRSQCHNFQHRIPKYALLKESTLIGCCKSHDQPIKVIHFSLA